MAAANDASGEPDHGGAAVEEAVITDLVQEMYAFTTALRRVRQQMDGTVPAYPPAQSDEPSPTVGDEHEVVASALLSAVSEVMLVDPGGDTAWIWPAQLVIDTALRGCRVRALFGSWPAHQASREFAEMITVVGGEVRTGAALDQAVLTVDMATALLSVPPASIVAAVTQPHVVRVLRGLLDAMWQTSSPSTAHGMPHTVHGQIHRRIIQLLAGGAKDETIARLLGISVRTCRRHIADIMAMLNAVSRFQAGANAVQYGLTSPPATSQQR